MITQAVMTVAVAMGLGNHMLILDPLQRAKALQWAWIAQCLLIQSIGFGKYAVIAFILRIQNRAQSKKTTLVTYSLYFIGVSNLAINIAMIGIIFTSCSPAAKRWNSALRGSCDHIYRTNHMGYAQGCMLQLFYGQGIADNLPQLGLPLAMSS